MKTRSLSHSVSWSFDFNHSVEEVWPLVSNTDRMNRAVGLSAVDYHSVANSLGGSIRYGKTSVAGFKLKWKESPYEWILNEEFGVQRDYSKGPLLAMDIAWKLAPINNTGCRMTQTVYFQPRNFLFSFITSIQIKYFTRLSFLKAYENIASFLNHGRATPFLASKKEMPAVEKSVFDTVITQLGEVNVTGDLAQKMTKHILESPQADLIRLKPFSLAKAWSKERLEVLTALLRGTNRGIFSLYWDLICPRCRGSKSTVTNLKNLEKKYHCDSCNIDFSAQFDKSVEVSFAVHPRVRKIEGGEYCVGGPQNTPHFASQIRLAPGESTNITLKLNEGVYRIRSLQSKGWRLLEAQNEIKAKEVTVVFNNLSTEEEKTEVCTGPVAIHLKNEQTHEIVVSINQVSWMQDVCTAAYVTSLQEFRNRFASEVLDPGQEISVSRVALLFTDLKGSTQMYQNIGDAKAYKFVRDHFEILTQFIARHEGAIVKTLGDAVMATFSSPASALKASIEIQRELHQNEKFKEHSKIKIGIHSGSCFLINCDGKLDYFGTNVNIAARTNGQCAGGDIVITQYMMNDPDVQKLVENCEYSVQKITRTLKGFDDQFILYQIDCTAKAQGPQKSLSKAV